MLPELESFVRIYDACPLLFWTVIGLASRCSEKHSDLYLRLAGPVRGLAAEVVNSPRRSLGIVQALVLLCLFPFPFRELESDRSLSYCGIASQMGLQLGLHRAEHDVEFCPEARLHSHDERLRTWAACYVVCSK